MNAPTESSTRLHGRSLLYARAAWFITVAVVLGLYVLSVPLQAQALQTACTDNCLYGQFTTAQMQELQQLGLSLNFYVTYNVALNIFFFLVFVGVGALIFWRKSNDWFGIYVALTLVLFGVSFSTPLLLIAKDYPALNIPALALYGIGGTMFGIFFYLFPDGRFVPRWTRWLIPLVVAREFAYAFFPESPILVLFPIELGTFVFAQIYRYRRSSNAVERQQTKWFVYGASIGILGFAGLILGVTLTSPTGQPTSALEQLIWGTALLFFILLIPLSIMMAILRYRLWDIDILIRRTVIYSILTSILALVYFGAVVLLQQLFHALTGAGGDLAIIVSTLAIAALFNPLRRRIQNIIDRRFYRRKFDAQKVLAHFAQTARDETDLEKLTDELMRVVDETMQPQSVSVWLRTPEREVKR